MQQQTCIASTSKKYPPGEQVGNMSVSEHFNSYCVTWIGNTAENQGEQCVSLEQGMADNDNGEKESKESNLEELAHW